MAITQPSAETTLKEIAARAPSSAFELPALAQEENWLTLLQEQLRTLVRTITSWIEARLPEGSSHGFFRMLVITILATLLALLGVALYRWFKRRRSMLISRGPVSSLPATMTRGKLEKALECALQNRQLALALRLRWQLFVFRLRRHPGLTLSEYAGAGWSGPPIAVLYKAMFGRAPAETLLFEQFDRYLAAVEQAGQVS